MGRRAGGPRRRVPEPFVDVHAFTPDDLGAWARDAGFDDVEVRGEELLANWFGWMNRTLEATALPEDVPWLWRQYAFRGYLLLQRVDVALLEGATAAGRLLQPHDRGAQAALMACRRGLVALGDSITVGEGSMQLGVTPLSWAQWLARALDLPYTCYAVNGAVVADVLHEQLPRCATTTTSRRCTRVSTTSAARASTPSRTRATSTPPRPGSRHGRGSCSC